MRWLKTVAMFGFLACWLAASNHCRLEVVPGLGFLACGEQDAGDPVQDKDCEADGCAAVEGAFYKIEDGQPALSAPSLVAVMSRVPLLLAEPSPAASRVNLDATPAELAATWQFSFRAAAPPRAPSPVS